MIDDNTWDMLLGKSGKVPGPVADEIKNIASTQGREFFEGNPQDLYPDELEKAGNEMKENGWETGADDEELFEYAMHPEQYKAYMSGAAKKTFDADLAKRKSATTEISVAKPAATAALSAVPAAFQPKTMHIEINGEKYEVNVSYADTQPAPVQKSEPASALPQPSSNGNKEILAPIEGNFMLTKSNSEKPLKVGDQVREGDLIGYIEAMKVYNAIHSDKSGMVTEICSPDGAHVDEDDLLIRLS